MYRNRSPRTAPHGDDGDGKGTFVLNSQGPHCRDTTRWAVRWTVQGDARFFSHHDWMRAMERLATRAKLPLRFSQGFNPRPTISLSAPRPVGVASRDERLVLTLCEEFTETELCDRLNAHAPAGVAFREAKRIEKSDTLLPRRVHYQAHLTPAQSQIAQGHWHELQSQETWEIERPGKMGKRGKKRRQNEPKRLDLKTMIENLTLADDTLSLACVPQDARWAKPREILALLGLTETAHVALLTRTEIEDDIYPGPTRPKDGREPDPQTKGTCPHE